LVPTCARFSPVNKVVRYQRSLALRVTQHEGEDKCYVYFSTALSVPKNVTSLQKLQKVQRVQKSLKFLDMAGHLAGGQRPSHGPWLEAWRKTGLQKTVACVMRVAKVATGRNWPPAVNKMAAARSTWRGKEPRIAHQIFEKILPGCADRPYHITGFFPLAGNDSPFPAHGH
jgi:hypothetical protein